MDSSGHRVTRRELYELAWSEPMRDLAKRYGVSDVALAKTCKRMHVPVPPRGYWNKKAAGQPALKVALPIRPVGLDDHVVLAGGRYGHYYRNYLSDEEALGPIPPEPTFDESLDEVAMRLASLVPKVTVPRELGLTPPAVSKLLKRDDEKRKQYAGLGHMYPWNRLVYDSPIQRRRLRLLSAIFLALAQQGCRADTWGGHPYDSPQDDFDVIVGDQRVRLRASVVQIKTPARAGRPASESPPKLRLVLDPGENKQSDGQVWEDGDETLERQARDVVLAILLTGERQFRDGLASSHRWRIARKTEIIERRRKEQEEAERKERERQAEMARKRVERLLGEAEAFRQASAIRDYVAEARRANSTLPHPAPEAEIEEWARWALAEADRIDPVRSGAFMAERE